MKQILLVGAFLLCLGALAQAVPTDVTYTEGDATTRYKDGTQNDTSIGDVLNTGDSVKTGADGQVEMDQKGVTIRVNHGTVFTLMEVDQGDQKSPVMSVALGSIRFRYNKLTGQEPLVRTNSAVLGVRGTEFTVFSGADGSTLIAVDQGQVNVEAEGKSVQLAAAEGVEVPLGKPPGDKFAVPKEKIDFSKWNDDKLNAMLSDPMAAMKSIEDTMATYVKNTVDYSNLYQQYMARLLVERANLAKIQKEQGDVAALKYSDSVVAPLSLQASNLGLNVRYSALAALSLRRFVAGRLYVFMKERYITNPHDVAYSAFLTEFGTFLNGFEEAIVPYLVKVDI